MAGIDQLIGLFSFSWIFTFLIPPMKMQTLSFWKLVVFPHTWQNIKQTSESNVQEQNTHRQTLGRYRSMTARLKLLRCYANFNQSFTKPRNNICILYSPAFVPQGCFLKSRSITHYRWHRTSSVIFYLQCFIFGSQFLILSYSRVQKESFIYITLP